MSAKKIIAEIKAAAKEATQELASDQSSGGPAPSDNAMGRFFSEIGAELKHQAEAGAHEAAAALFRGDAFVMYGGREGAEQDNDPKPWERQVTQEQVKEPEQEQDNGMEM